MKDSTPPTAARIAEEWWHDLLGVEQPGQRGPHRAALARLRRAATPLEVIQEPVALRLVARLPRDPDRVAILAGVLAFVRESDNERVARVIGRRSLDDEESILAEARFRRLLQVRDDELMDQMRRLVRLTKGRANVYDLAYAILHWGDRVKKRWIFDYYGVSGAFRPVGDSAQVPTPDAP